MEDTQLDRRTLMEVGTALAAAFGSAGCLRLSDQATSTATGSTATSTGDAGETDLETIAYGETRMGQLDEGDTGDNPPQGSVADPVTFEGSQGDQILLKMQSSALDPYLAVANPQGQVVAQNDDGATGNNAIVQMTLGASGAYTVWAGSASGDATGEYVLSLTKTGVGQVDDVRSIGYGATREGNLDEDDPQVPDEDRRGEPIEFSGATDDIVDVSLQSPDYDTYLFLEDPGGEIVARNDDGGDDLNSRLRTALDQSGTFTIWASSYDQGATGSYTLTLEKVGEVTGGQDLQSIAYGESVEGEVDWEDQHEDAPTSRPAEAVTFQGSRPDEVRISVNADGFEPSVELTGPDGDHFGRTGNRLQTVIPTTGTYTIWVSSRSTIRTGTYTLSLQKTGEATINENLRSLSYGESAYGEVDQSDPRDPFEGNLGEPVTFEGAERDAIVATMESAQLDERLVLEDPNGEVTRVGGDGGASRIDAGLRSSGTYTLWATAEYEDTGVYELSLDHTGEATGGLDLRSISFGQTAEGELDEMDPSVPTVGKIGEPVTFEGTGGDTVVISMESDPVDTYLYLASPGGQIVAENDDHDGLNSRIEHTLTGSGTYTIWASSYEGAEMGPYFLTLERA